MIVVLVVMLPMTIVADNRPQTLVAVVARDRILGRLVFSFGHKGHAD
jgi:hypothetical protein